MTTPPAAPPPDAGHDEKAAEAARAQAAAPEFAQVTEALNGLKELAARVQLPNPPLLSSDKEDLVKTQEQLSLELPVAVVPPAPQTPPQRRPRVGESLREAREAAGFTLEEVAEELKIKPFYLQAIEESRYDDLPTRTHAVGFVRTYAAALQLHSEELVVRCRSEIGTVIPRMAPVTRVSTVDRRLPGGALMTACAVLAVLVYIVSYSAFRTPPHAPLYPAHPPQVEAVTIPDPPPLLAKPVEAKAPEAKKNAETPAPAVSNTTETAPASLVLTEPTKSAEGTSALSVDAAKPGAAAPPSRIKLHAAEDVEVRIMDEKGRILAERMIHKGEAFFVPDQKNYTLSTSDAGALKVQIDGREMPSLGEDGEAMHNIPLNSTDLLEVLAE